VRFLPGRSKGQVQRKAAKRSIENTDGFSTFQTASSHKISRISYHRLMPLLPFNYCLAVRRAAVGEDYASASSPSATTAADSLAVAKHLLYPPHPGDAEAHSRRPPGDSTLNPRRQIRRILMGLNIA
jgi:hypothetical protein